MTPIIGLMLLGLFSAPQVEVQHLHVKSWVMALSRDRFTGQVRCAASAPGLALEDGDLRVMLRHLIDLENAVYRLDGGPAELVADLPEDTLFRESHSSALDGQRSIRFRAQAVMAVRRIDARSDPKSKVITFDVSQLPAVLAAEAASGCTATSTAAN